MNLKIKLQTKTCLLPLIGSEPLLPVLRKEKEKDEKKKEEDEKFRSHLEMENVITSHPRPLYLKIDKLTKI